MVEDYPVVEPIPKDAATVTIAGDVLADALKKTAFAADDFKGFSFQCSDDGTLITQGSDGHRFARVFGLPIASSDELFKEVILIGDIPRHLIRAFGPAASVTISVPPNVEKDPATGEVSRRPIRFQSKYVRLATYQKSVSDTYSKLWDTLSPLEDSNSICFRVPRAEFIAAIKSAMVSASKVTKLLCFTFTPGEIHISAEDKEGSRTLVCARSELVRGKVPNAMYGVNGLYLLDGLSHFEGVTVDLYVQNDTLYPICFSCNAERYTYIVQPMRIGDARKE